ncbi:MAG: hypothetical protein EOO44_21100 [Flavobacterium sp.]|nr:MAG: hypothetical protein EOO44_21100 [Flavobacterium sp.]
MQAIYSKLLLTTLFIFLFSPSRLINENKHPLHVSTTEIEFNSKEKSLEISCRIFTDDFETVLAKQFKTKTDLTKPSMHKAMDELIKKYMAAHLKLNVNGKNATRTFEGNFKLSGDLVEQKTTGYNLVTKESGSRSHTASANQVDANEAIKHLKKNPEEQIEFNASHVLADQFLGSGYKTALNLVTASGHYNKETMRGAEERLLNALNRTEKIYKNRDSQNYITFDIKVTAKWKELVDSTITSELAKLNPNTDKELLESMHKILARNVDPKLVQSVVYEVIGAKLNGTKEIRHNIRPIEIGADETLQKTLK